jgi:hypothetical protein
MEPWRTLVVANETIGGEALHEAVRRSGGDPGSEVLVIAPALSSRIRHWTSDTDDARLRAELRLARCIARLRAAGVTALGYVADADPMQAIADALPLFAADEIVIATHEEGRSNWLARDLVGRACHTCGLPVLHVVVQESREPATLALTAA